MLRITNVLYTIELPLKGYPFRGPGPADQVKRLHHPLTTLALVNPKTGEVSGDGAAANPKLNPAIADRIEGGNLLSHPHRMGERQQDNRNPQA